MSAQMEKVREALAKSVLGGIFEAEHAAALAEVEEWEKALAALVVLKTSDRIVAAEARAETAEAERDEAREKCEVARKSAATNAAEADRLKAALTEAIRIDRIGHMPGEESSWVPQARAALAPAAVDYSGPDPSVECAYTGCKRRLRRSSAPGPQFCSKAHRDSAGGTT